MIETSLFLLNPFMKPSCGQVKKFGLKGRTKYTHLTDQVHTLSLSHTLSLFLALSLSLALSHSPSLSLSLSLSTYAPFTSRYIPWTPYGPHIDPHMAILTPI